MDTMDIVAGVVVLIAVITAVLTIYIQRKNFATGQRAEGGDSQAEALSIEPTPTRPAQPSLPPADFDSELREAAEAPVAPVPLPVNPFAGLEQELSNISEPPLIASDIIAADQPKQKSKYVRKTTIKRKRRRTKAEMLAAKEVVP